MWVFEPEPNPTKDVCGKSLRSKLWPVSSAKLVMWRLFDLSNIVRSILSGTPQFVCLKSSEKFEKWTRENESLFTMKMRTLTHRLKSAPYWLVKTSNWRIIRHTALTRYPMTSFYSRMSRKMRDQRFSSPKYVLMVSQSKSKKYFDKWFENNIFIFITSFTLNHKSRYFWFNKL